VIREHVESALPVASAELVRRYRMGVSPATVRAELAALEELGLLTHPHTSAGRVPTDLGYRYFIEALMPHPDLREDERVTLSHQFRQARPDTSEWLRLAASTLARLTREAAIATYDRALEPREVTWGRQIHYEGIDLILMQPEFRAGERVRSVVSLLQDRQLLAQVLPVSLGEGDVAVSIGSEHALEPLRPLSLVIGRYGSDETVGYVGVVGPTRMDYHRTIGAVRYVGALMSDLVRALDG
jgi:transcriptional regulator of heat shock response